MQNSVYLNTCIHIIFNYLWLSTFIFLSIFNVGVIEKSLNTCEKMIYNLEYQLI